MRSLKVITLALLLCTTIVACREPVGDNEDQGKTVAQQATRVSVQVIREQQAKPDSIQKIALVPLLSDNADKPKLISTRDDIFLNFASCIYTISYQPRTDHEVRWKGNKCVEPH
jgi:hypothetical protein